MNILIALILVFNVGVSIYYRNTGAIYGWACSLIFFVSALIERNRADRKG